MAVHLQSTDQFGLKTEYTYDDFGNVIQVRRESPDETGTKKWLVNRTVYDKQGRVSVATNTFLENASATFATKTVYDEQGRVRKTIRLENIVIAVNPANGTSAVTSDGSNPQTSETRYDQNGRVAKTISPEGVVTSHEYDSLGRQTKTVTGGLQTATEYDSMGRVARVSVCDMANPTDSRVASYLYDAFGNIVQTTNPNGTKIMAEYDPMGRKKSETNQLKQTRQFDYDAAGRLIRVTMPGSVEYEYAYDAHGNQTSIKDPLNHVTKFDYDTRGNMVKRTLPMGQVTPTGHVETFQFDDYGRQTLHVSFDGIHAKSEYDSFGRLATKKYYANATTYAAGTIVETLTYKFDAFGREKQVTQAWPGMRTWNTTTTYNPQGRIASLQQAYGTTSYLYDEFGRQKTVTLNTGEKTDYSYDNQGRLATVRDKDNQLTEYEYNAFGNRAKTTLPNGVVTTYTYDAMNRMTVEEAKKGSTPVSKFTYGYDDLGQKTQATELHRINGVDKSIVTDWEYDVLNRVTQEKLVHHDVSLSKTQTWQYDAVGNRTQQKCGTQTTTYVYNDNDQLTVEQLTDTSASANNRLTQRAYSAQRMTQEKSYYGSTTANQECCKDFEYRHEGRIHATQIRRYFASGAFQSREYVRTMYDETGMAMFTDRYTNPVDDTNYTAMYRSEFVYDRHNPTGHTQVMRERCNNTLGGGNVLVRTHAHTFGHERVSEKTTITSQPNAPQTYFFVHDGLANTRSLTDTAGAPVQRFDYDAYGNAVGFNPSQALTQFLYCGELFDHQLGFYYLRARYYDPKVGRFNRLDPFFGNLSDPQSLHKYTYCHGDPVNCVDPSGMFLALVSVGASTILNTTLRGLTAGAIVGAFSGGGIAFVSGGTWQDMVAGVALGAVYGAFLGTAIGYSIATKRFASVLVEGLLQGITCCLAEALSQLMKCVHDWDGRAIGFAALDGMVWGTFSAAFGINQQWIAERYASRSGMTTNDRMVYESSTWKRIVLAVITSALQDIMAYSRECFTNKTDKEWPVFLAETFVHVVEVGILSAVSSKLVNEMNNGFKGKELQEVVTAFLLNLPVSAWFNYFSDLYFDKNLSSSYGIVN